MPPAAILFILVGGLLLRQVMVGRVKDIPSDAKSLANSFLNADAAGIKTVATQRGQNVTVDGAATVASGTPSTVTPDSPGASPGAGKLPQEMIRLGRSAKGYILGSNGPDYYDCSSLVWVACRNLGIFKGARFTTSNFRAIARPWATQVTTPIVGDLVLWPTHHMGVYAATDQMYSARSPSKGIGFSSISGDSTYFKSVPEYWRPNA